MDEKAVPIFGVCHYHRVVDDNGRPIYSCNTWPSPYVPVFTVNGHTYCAGHALLVIDAMSGRA